MSDTIEVAQLAQAFETIKETLNAEQKKEKLMELQQLSSAPNFWSNDEKARQTMQRIANLEDELKQLTELETKISDLKALEELLAESEDVGLKAELETEKKLGLKLLEQLKVNSYLNDVHDDAPAILSIHAGQGGTEAMDWASMLQRMYMHYFEKANYEYQIVDISVGEEAGIKSVTFIVKGKKAYGYLKGETGTHRLVRLSPFNADNLRQTSFAGVEVTPLIQGQTKIDIKDEDLEWQFFRSGGAGGQNVNKVNTAVRVKHLPTGLVISSQSERTQVRNREIALEILQSKLEKIRQEEEEKQTNILKGDHKIAGWGNQIRNYILHPYQLVKDVRTGVETSNTEAVLGGELKEFIDAEVAWLAVKKNSTNQS